MRKGLPDSEKENGKESGDEDNLEEDTEEDEEAMAEEWDKVNMEEYNHGPAHYAGALRMLRDMALNGFFQVGPHENSGAQQEKE
jgi:hypothetical protein